MNKCLIYDEGKRTNQPTFMSSIKDGNPPIDIKVTNPDTNEAHEPLACKSPILLDLQKQSIGISKPAIIKENPKMKWLPTNMAL